MQAVTAWTTRTAEEWMHYQKRLMKVPTLDDTEVYRPSIYMHHA